MTTRAMGTLMRSQCRRTPRSPARPIAAALPRIIAPTSCHARWFALRGSIEQGACPRAEKARCRVISSRQELHAARRSYGVAEGRGVEGAVVVREFGCLSARAELGTGLARNKAVSEAGQPSARLVATPRAEHKRLEVGTAGHPDLQLDSCSESTIRTRLGGQSCQVSGSPPSRRASWGG